jgi:hypothetical protein
MFLLRDAGIYRYCMVTAQQGPSTGSTFSTPISVLKGTHTMLYAQHKTLTAENTFKPHYMDILTILLYSYDRIHTHSFTWW